MPTYEYKCNDCKKEFEIISSYRDTIGVKPYCPDCCSNNTIKKFSKFSIIFRGNGFYKTDNSETLDKSNKV